MDNSSWHINGKRSGYEPSDTETEWQDTPRRDRRNSGGIDAPRNNTSLLKPNLSSSSKFEFCHEIPTTEKNAVTSPIRRRHSSKSPYKPKRDDVGKVSSMSNHRNISPIPKSQQRQKQTSPYKPRIPTREEKGTQLQAREDTRGSERSSSGRRSATAPRQRTREKEHVEQKGERTISPLPGSMIRKQREATHKKMPSGGEINEMVANAKIARASTSQHPAFLDSTDSISPGDIFFSVAGLPAQKNDLPKNGSTENHTYVLPKNGSSENHIYPRPTMYFSASNGSYQKNRNGLKNSTSSGITRTTSSSALSGQSSENSKITDVSGRTTTSMRKFTDNRRKNQSEPWFACMRKGSCRTSKSPERVEFDEAAYIEKAFVVENLRQFWADKHQPGSLNGFTCHKQEAQLLKQLVSQNIYPHVLFKGPSGSGKKALTMALLSEIYGDACRHVSHELRAFVVQDRKPMQVVVPVTSSAHHIELNVKKLEANARYALMGIVKEISNYYAVAPEVSTVNFKPDYKVIVLYDVDKAPENTQHLIKWIMDSHNDACKLILCCNDDADIIESVKNHCEVINVYAPVTNEIMEVLLQIAKKEGFDLSMSFAGKLASKSKQNLRKAIMALETCKAHIYPFSDDQPIPIGWEEVLVELAEETLADPSPKRLFLLRGKLQKLLVDFVHPRLILQKLSEQFLKGVHASSRREVYYWHAYYDKRLPTGTAALLKLEEYVAKFMSIHRKSFVNRPHFV
ncbi:uncharacterized protein LOC120012150 isoform X2 [Tripterygium wilfordii]|uniref:uncharacterized protein LOC120012150 isoform X2 n=1 Tax=Tripterygium wilfordii TaxID=458696 RepID=UPI0018F85F6A|nr:uncharacterized protein LOC120012150 isoform X2 [Tripterygium wilfordii]